MGILDKAVDRHNERLGGKARGRIITPTDDEFGKYGQIIPIDKIPTRAVHEDLLKALADEVAKSIGANQIGYNPALYVISDNNLLIVEERGDSLNDMRSHLIGRGKEYTDFSWAYFDAMRVQIGLCWGRDTSWRLKKGLEDHLNPISGTYVLEGQTYAGSREIIVNESPKSNILILGKSADVRDVNGVPTIDALTCTAVKMEPSITSGVGVVLDADTFHLNPQGSEVMAVIYLKLGTNMEMIPDMLRMIRKMDPTYVATGKRVFATPGGGFFEGETCGRVSNYEHPFLNISGK